MIAVAVRHPRAAMVVWLTANIAAGIAWAVIAVSVAHYWTAHTVVSGGPAVATVERVQP